MSDPSRGIVEQVMQSAFRDGTRTPRSPAYQDGCRAALAYRFEGRRIAVPFVIGTAEADAFFSGVDEGHRRFREHEAARADSAPAAGR